MANDENSCSSMGRPQRSTRVPKRFDNTGEPGAAAGYGVTTHDAPMTCTNGNAIARDPPNRGRAGAPVSPAGEETSRLGLSVLSHVANERMQQSQSLETHPTCRDSAAFSSAKKQHAPPPQPRLPGITGRSAKNDGGETDDSSSSESEESDEDMRLPNPTPSRRQLGLDGDTSDDDEEQGEEEDHEATTSARGKGNGKGKAKSKASKAKASGSPQNAGGVTSPASGSGTGRRDHADKLRASAGRAESRKLQYTEMAMHLLRRICKDRGIKGMSHEKSTATLASKLKSLDAKQGRTSPYYGDFGQYTENRESAAV